MIPAGLELLDELLAPSTRVAVGLDYAASEENWGLCVLVLPEALDDVHLLGMGETDLGEITRLSLEV